MTLPGTLELIGKTASVSQLREVQIEDLLGRDEVMLDPAPIKAMLRGRTVLVTGGGGSIGSELCRQIAKYSPQKLVIFDIYENNAYDIQQELKFQYGADLDLAVEIGSIRDRERLMRLMERYRPEVVFHAAAHKHVPLMESCPQEAIRNNVFGTLNLVRAADAYGVQKFIQISTDKAVNPTNIMGREQAAVRDDRAVHGAMLEHHLRCRPFRKRSRLERLGHPALPPPDRRGRPPSP